SLGVRRRTSRHYKQLVEENAMRHVGVCRLLFALALVAVLTPSAAYAQGGAASITGVVKDTSGAVLPGVTVEASSPALIEKTRTVVTDGTGQYRIVSLG